jgi:hypothetical protein
VDSEARRIYDVMAFKSLKLEETLTLLDSSTFINGLFSTIYQHITPSP